MYENVRIRNFRGFAEFELPEAGRFNILTGRNGCGKTAVLEALFLLAGGDNSSLVMSIATLRGLTSSPIDLSSFVGQLWETLFHDLRSQAPIELSANWVGDGQRVRQSLRLSLGSSEAELLRGGDQLDLHGAGLDSGSRTEATHLLWEHHRSGRTKVKSRLIVDEQGLRIEPAPKRPFSPGFYLATRSRIPAREDSDRFGNLELRGDVEGFLNAVRIVEPSLRRVATVSRGGVPIVHADIGLDTLLPIALLGDGVSRLASLMLGIASARNGVALIDEIENGFHFSTLPQVWQAIVTACKHYNTQLFVTSHSLECMRASTEALRDSEEDVRLIRIEKTERGPVARTFQREKVLSALSGDVEIR